MSRRVFISAVLLLLVVMMCCGGAAAQGENAAATAPASGSPLKNAVEKWKSNSGDGQELQMVDLFVPQTTPVLPKGQTSSGTQGTTETKRDSFVSPSLVSAGGVIAAFSEGHIKAQYTADGNLSKPILSDVVVGYLDAKWDWSALVGEVNKSTWKARIVLNSTDGKTNNCVSGLLNPAAATKGNKVFLLAGSFDVLQKSGNEWKQENLGLKVVVGEVTKPTSSEPTGRIEWGQINSPLNESIMTAHKGELKDFIASGGSGVLMEDGTLVFPLMAVKEPKDVFSLLIYSTDNGRTWALSKGVSPAKCYNPRVTEWEGSLLMIVDCKNGHRVYESRDMGTTWKEAVGKLLGVWTKSQSKAIWDVSLHVDALITATIEKRKVMLYTQRGYFSGAKEAAAFHFSYTDNNRSFSVGHIAMDNPLYLWVTDNNRTFSLGPVATDTAAKWEFASNLLYSNGNLHLLQRRGILERSGISLSRLTKELSKIKSVLSNWVRNDIFFSTLSIPTTGLVAVLSDAANDDTWNDEYRCLNARVKNAKKVKDGLKLTEPNSGVLWPVNDWGHDVRHVFLRHDFTLVASVTIEGSPSKNTPLLTAMLANTESKHTVGLSYTTDKKWETAFKDKTTTQSGSWEPKKEYQAALMLQGKKASVYIDGQLLREEEVPLTAEKTLDFVYFCFGACHRKEVGHKTPVTLKNVFLYNRPLNSTEMQAIKDRSPFPTRGPVKQVEGGAERRHIPQIEGVQANAFAGSGLLSLLFLLGLWVFAAA
ncbi:trans-sialidase, putative [Trypanosoma cruzi marinkellei]|uniref:Trans-sialidase, putative n=1 Tax=Trypanosoma cruzi marinkellei TaxID=85056 RepID=K2NX11_TRYCR|nr:trans-sialidase, putative [Trypanosoma cruzi marinkellei]